MSDAHQMSIIDQSKPLWRCLYIAKDHTGELLGMVLAPSYAIAQAYFVGTQVTPHTIEVIDPCDAKSGDCVSGICVIARSERHHVTGSWDHVTKLVR